MSYLMVYFIIKLTSLVTLFTIIGVFGTFFGIVASFVGTFGGTKSYDIFEDNEKGKESIKKNRKKSINSRDNINIFNNCASNY